MNIYKALSATTGQINGITKMQVYYDTLLVGCKVNTGGINSHEFLLIEKLSFDYDAATLSTDNKGYVLKFGNTGMNGVDRSRGNCYIDTILLEKEKKLLICGLSTLSADVEVNYSGTVYDGASYIPMVYEYDINKHQVELVFPPNSSVAEEWKSVYMGTKHGNYPPVIGWNADTSQIHCMYKTILNAVTGTDHVGINHIVLNYRPDEVALNSFAMLSADDNSNTPSIKKITSYDNETVVWAGIEYGADYAAMIPFKIVEA